MRFRWAHLAVLLALAALGTVSSQTRATSAESSLLRQYRSWRLLTPKPVVVPFEFSIQCSLVTEEQLAEARRAHGPHTNRMLRIYANAPAMAAVRDESVRKYPAGAMIAKEKLRMDGSVEAVAFMIKHSEPHFRQSGGWEFLFTPRRGSSANYDGCVACHRGGGAKDYVFGHYGPRRVE